MKCFATLLVGMCLSLDALSQVTTQNVTILNGNYYWSNTDNWVSGTQPSGVHTGIEENVVVATGSKITRDGNLTFTTIGGNPTETLTVNGTLIVTGNVTFANVSQSLVVNGLMIVLGNFEANNKADVTASGQLLIKGTMTLNNGNQDYNGEGSDTGSNLYVGMGPVIGSSSDVGLANGDNDPLTNFPQDIQDFINGVSSILPIVLGNFSADSNENLIKLNWQTISEENFDFFSIERSEDGQNFYEIGTVLGHGDSNDPIDYNFVDENPLFGTSFYRLNAIDYDGTYEKFQVLSVEFIPDELQVSIYPNPGNGKKMSLRLGLPTEASVKTVSVYNLSGEQILEKELKVGKNELDIQQYLGKGFYFAKIQIDNYTTTKKLIIN